ncbi:FAD-dependent oxidoreductase [Paenibacillus bovis]|uniref:FAD-dependent oxidoreductase n=1 Tax=Paenibacillus bovis TaxID=1616788 RepID=UPI000B306C1E|nr:FAD-dependent oxidoreductase [Paenibacillus bovis]
MNKKVIVIGSGVAGLATAIRLQVAGYQVEIYEKGSTPGGKMNRIELGGAIHSIWGRAS